MARTQSIGILVVGGSEATRTQLVRILSLLGCRSPSLTSQAQGGDNPSGRDGTALLAVHEAALDLVAPGSASFRGIDAAVRGSPALDELLQAAVAALEPWNSGEPNVVWSAPGIEHLLPFWLQALREANVSPRVAWLIDGPAHIPPIVSGSSEWPKSLSDLAGLRATLMVERASRGMSRTILDSSKLEADWRGQTARLKEVLALEWSPWGGLGLAANPERLQAKPASDMQSVETGGAFLTGGASLIRSWNIQLGTVLQRWTETGERASDQTVFDRVGERVDAALEVMGPVLQACADRNPVDMVMGTATPAQPLVIATAPAIQAGAQTDEAITGSRLDDLRRQVARSSNLVRQAGRERDEARANLEKLWTSLQTPRAKLLRWLTGLPASQPVSKLQRQDAKQIAAHRLFDAAWYDENYPRTVRLRHDPALDYVLANGKRHPGPEFRDIFYTRANPDVAEAGVDPYLHYVRYGEAEERSVRHVVGAFSFEESDAAAAASPASVAPGPPSNTATRSALGFSRPVLTALSLLVGDDEHSLVVFGGVPLGLEPIDTKDGMPWRVATRVLERLLGWRDEYEVTLPVAAGGETIGLGVARIVDLWFVNEFDLRIRVEHGNEASEAERLFFYQAGDGVLQLCGEAVLDGAGPIFAEARLLNPYYPMLITLVNPGGLLLSATLLPFPSLARGGAHHAEVSARGLRAHAMDNFIALSEALLHEWLGWTDALPLAVGRIEVDLAGATGSERIFRPSTGAWLQEMMGVSVEPANLAGVTVSSVREHLVASLSANASLVKSRAEAPLSLIIPADALPSLSALLSRRLTRQTAAAGSYLMADAVTGRPKLSVALPAGDADLMALQPAEAPTPFPILAPSGNAPLSTAVDGAMSLPLAIRYPARIESEASLLFRRAPDAAGPLLRTSLDGQLPAGGDGLITVLILAQETPAQWRDLLAALARQTLASSLHLLVGVAVDFRHGSEVAAMLEAALPGQSTIHDDQGTVAARLNALAQRARGPLLLVLSDSITPHDPRTIETLATLALARTVASAGCVQVREVSAPKDQLNHVEVQAGGFFPSQIALRSSPNLVFDQPACLDAFPHATYPVVANDSRVMMMRSALWQELGGLDAARFPAEGSDLDLGLRALKAGYRNLSTSAVTVSTRAPRSAPWRSDIVATDYLALPRWQEIVNGVALIRELR